MIVIRWCPCYNDKN